MGIFAKKKKWTLTIQEGLPDDIYMKAAQALGEGIINDDFSAFESMLDDNVRWEWAKESRSPIIGRNEVIGYWKDWVKRVTHDKLDVEFEVKFCTFYSRTTLAISPNGYATAYVLFYIENGLIELGVFVGRIIDRINLFGKAGNKWEETLDHFPLALQDKDIKEISKQEARGNRMPCLNCGRTSEMLSWENFVFSNSSIDFCGAVSKCPSCGKVVEFVFDEESALHDDNRLERVIGTKKEEELWMTNDMFQIGLYYTMPLRHSEYIASLFKGESIKMKVAAATLGATKRKETSPYAAAKFMEQVLYVLYMENYDEYEKIKNCYIDALNNGVYEAANNLGILTYNVEHLDKEKGLEYFRIAAEHNSTAALKNLVKIFWQERKYEVLISLLRDDNGKNEFEIEGNVFQRISKFEIIKSNLDYSQFIHVLFPEIQIVRDWYISVRLYSDGKNAIRDESYFYVANSKNSATYFDMESNSVKFEGERDFLIWKYVVVSKSTRAIWELYLLMNANTILPYWWHGGYRQRVFIFDDSDFAKIPALRDRDVSAVIDKGYTRSSVEIEDCEGGFDAHVYCCYWNEWKGLVREHVIMKVQENRVVEYKHGEDFVIFSYNCGILY
nr:hypothetical protein [uncultured Prevotella sp.]